MALAEPEVFQPSAAAVVAGPSKTKKNAAMAAAPPLGKSKRQPTSGGTPRFSMSPGMIVLVVLAILIPAAIFWAKTGPMAAMKEWERVRDLAEDNVVSQVTSAIQYQYAEDGFDMKKFQPKALNIVFDSNGMMIRLPDDVHIWGRSTEGEWRGTFHPKTQRFEVDVKIEGADHKVSGSSSETDLSLDLDGKKIR
jgi:hypothetical protein